MTILQTLEMALEALEYKGNIFHIDCNAEMAITALRTQIALEKKAENARELGLNYYIPCCKDQTCPKCIAAQWVGLTMEDKQEYVAQDYGGNRLDAMDWAEKRLKEKNT